MSALTDLVEKAKSIGTQVFDKIQETSAFQKAKERYDGLPANAQKAVIGAAAFLTFCLIMSFPLSSYFAASDSVTEFEEKRSLIQDLFKVSTEGQASLPVDPPPPLDSLKSQIEGRLKQSQLMPEQIKGISLDSVPNVFSKEIVEGAISISLEKLNLRQVVDLGYTIQSISSGTKMVDMIVQANAADTHYFDVIYKLISLKVPDFSTPLDPDAQTPGTGSGSGRKKIPPKAKKADDDL